MTARRRPSREPRPRSRPATSSPRPGPRAAVAPACTALFSWAVEWRPPFGWLCKSWGVVCVYVYVYVYDPVGGWMDDLGWEE